MNACAMCGAETHESVYAEDGDVCENEKCALVGVIIGQSELRIINAVRAAAELRGWNRRGEQDAQKIKESWVLFEDQASCETFACDIRSMPYEPASEAVAK